MSLPLHKGLIVTSYGVEILIILGELNSHDMLGMTSEGNRFVTSPARVSENVDETVVITSGNKSSICREVNSVDVGAVSARGEDAID